MNAPAPRAAGAEAVLRAKGQKMSIRKYVKNPYLVPAGTYIARVQAVKQKERQGRSWTVVCFEILDGFFKRRLVYDIIRRKGFSQGAVVADRAREAVLVGFGKPSRTYTRACRAMIDRQVEVEVDIRWREDMERASNWIKTYRCFRGALS